jgi:hypothetical protein
VVKPCGVGAYARAVLVAATVALTGCRSTGRTGSGVDGGASDAGDEPATPFTLDAMRAASVAYMTKFCAAAAECDPDYFAVEWGTQDNCVDADAGAADLSVWFPYGSTLTPDALTACAAALDLSTCEKYALLNYEFQAPPECMALSYGTLPNGSACANNGIPAAPFWNQCASGRCFTTGSPCGTCIAALSPGETCNGAEYCALGEGCVFTSASTTGCVPYADVGASCSPSVPCHTYLECLGGTCVVPPADGTCDPQYGCAVFPNERVCDPVQKKCLSTVKNLGDACGYDAAGDFLGYCTFPYACSAPVAGSGGGADAGSDGGGPQDVCVPMPAVGEPCIPTGLFEDCPRSGLRFDTCTNNVCTEGSAAQCSAPPPPP